MCAVYRHSEAQIHDKIGFAREMPLIVEPSGIHGYSVFARKFSHFSSHVEFEFKLTLLRRSQIETAVARDNTARSEVSFHQIRCGKQSEISEFA